MSTFNPSHKGQGQHFLEDVELPWEDVETFARPDVHSEASSPSTGHTDPYAGQRRAVERALSYGDTNLARALLNMH